MRILRIQTIFLIVLLSLLMSACGGGISVAEAVAGDLDFASGEEWGRFSEDGSIGTCSTSWSMNHEETYNFFDLSDKLLLSLKEGGRGEYTTFCGDEEGNVTIYVKVDGDKVYYHR